MHNVFQILIFLAWPPEHQNYFGFDDNLGPVAVSIRRERLDDGKEKDGMQFNYRVTFRTSQVTIIRRCARIKLLWMHGRRNLCDLYRTIKELTVSQNMLLKHISYISHTLHLARHVKVTQLKAHSGGTRMQKCFSPLKTRHFLAAFCSQICPSTLMCPVILCQLWLSWPVKQTLMRCIRVGVITLARLNSHTHTHTHRHAYAHTKLINTQTEMQSLTVPGGAEPFSLIEAGWSHSLNNSGATDVSGRKMSLISSAILGLKHHFHDKTIYLGHGSLASSTQKLPNHWSIYLHALGSFSVSLSAPLSLFFALWVYQVIYFSDSLSVGQPLIAGIHVHRLCGWKEDLWP